MPGLDKTGPMGQGAQTGRKQGRCNTALTDDLFTRFGFGRRGGGRGLRNRNLAADDSIQTGWGHGKGRGRGRGFGRLDN
jgi:hypothetical protein